MCVICPNKSHPRCGEPLDVWRFKKVTPRLRYAWVIVYRSCPSTLVVREDECKVWGSLDSPGIAYKKATTHKKKARDHILFLCVSISPDHLMKEPRYHCNTVISESLISSSHLAIAFFRCASTPGMSSLPAGRTLPSG